MIMSSPVFILVSLLCTTAVRTSGTSKRVTRHLWSVNDANNEDTIASNSLTPVVSQHENQHQNLRQFVFYPPSMNSGNDSLVLGRAILKGTVGINTADSNPNYYHTVHPARLFHGAVETRVVDQDGTAVSTTLHGAATNVMTPSKVLPGFGIPGTSSTRSGKHQTSHQRHRNKVVYSVNSMKKCCSSTLPIEAPRGSDRIRLHLPLCYEGKPHVVQGPKVGSTLHQGKQQIVLKFPNGRLCKSSLEIRIRKCVKLSSLTGVSIYCSKGEIWGSKCIFSCQQDGFIIQGNDMTSCEEGENGDLQWSEDTNAVCIDDSWCHRPLAPVNGYIGCSPPTESEYIASATRCTYHCISGYRIPYSQKHLRHIHCRDGEWSQHSDPTCVVSSHNNRRGPSVTYLGDASNSIIEHIPINNQNDNTDNSCQSNPCQNGGTCITIPSQTQPLCLCTHIWAGPTCDIRQCPRNHCYFGASCVIKDGRPRCLCPEGTRGIRCQVRIQNDSSR